MSSAKKKRCLVDGFKIDDDGYSFPNQKKPNGKFGFDRAIFCGPSCALFYCDVVKRDSPQYIIWIHLHVRRDLKILEPIPMSPDPRLLAKYNRDGVGLSKQQFREFKNAHKIVEKIRVLPLDLRVWVQEPQEDYKMSFHETITGQRALADLLLREHQEAGKPIPKILLTEVLSNGAEAACMQQQAQQPEDISKTIIKDKQEEEEEEEERDYSQREEEEECKTANPEPPPQQHTKQAKPKSILCKKRQKEEEEEQDSSQEEYKTANPEPPPQHTKQTKLKSIIYKKRQRT